MMRTVPVLLLLLLAGAMAESATQTDWSGGPGLPGPVDVWGTGFSSGTADYFTQQGQLSITWGKLTDSGTEIPGSQLYAIGAYPGDVDLDGDLDILAASSVDNVVLWWENIDGSAEAWTSHEISTGLGGAWGTICSDIDQDGDNDVFGSAMGDGVILWWENTDGMGLNWTGHSIDDSLAGAKAICTADINGDGLADLAAAAKTDDVIVWYEHPGTGTNWVKTVIAPDYDGANSVYPMDMDGDGDLDILAAAKSDKAIRWYENGNGGSSWTAHSVVEDLDYARTAEAVDVDGDGDPDVIGTGGISKASGRVCWWENTDGTGTTWTEHTLNGDFQGPYTVLHHDMDNDGDPDIASGSLTFNGIYWWENDGQGSGWEEHRLCNYYAPRTFSVADLDGDGDPEVFAGSLYGFNIMIWEILGYGESSLVSSILDTGGDSDWTELGWTADQPAGTAVGIALRSSWDPANMGEWSDTVFSGPLDPSILIDDNDRFVQYAVLLQSDDPAITPALQEITISWNPLGIGEETSSGSPEMHAVNPSTGSLSISCSVPDGEEATLSLFDLSGRLVFQSVRGAVTSATGAVGIRDLMPGVYFASLDHRTGTETARFTVLK